MKFLFLSLLFFSEEAFTSQEGVLQISDFSITSAGIAESGPITVNGKRDKSGAFDSVVVSAFGKKIEIPKNLLSKIPERTNGIQLSYETGFGTGAKVVYVKFEVGFTSRPVEHITLVARENGTSDLLK